MKLVNYLFGTLLLLSSIAMCIVATKQGLPAWIFAIFLLALAVAFFKYPKKREAFLAEQKEKERETDQMCRHIEQARLEDMPTFEVSVQLQKNETCYFIAEVAWKEMRKSTTSRRYEGVGINIKIAKGVYYRVGNIKTVPNTSTELTTLDTGILYFTDKRLIFAGNKGNKVMPLNKIFDLTLYSDAITVQKDTGKPATLFPIDGTPTKLIVAMISKLMQ